MKKLFLTILLSIFMILTLLPAAAFADDGNGKPTQLWVNNVNIMEEGSENAVEGASYDPETNTLTLNNITIDQTNSDFKNNNDDDYSFYAIVSGIYADGDLNVHLEGENSGIRSKMLWYTFLISGELNITGSGSLDIFGSCGIQAKEDISICGTGTMTIESELNCINSETGNINIADSMEKIKLIALESVLCCEGEGCTITVGDNILSADVSSSLGMVINKGKIEPVSQAEVMVGGVDVSNGSVEGAEYDEESNTLTLKNANIDSCEEMYKAAIFSAEDLTIVLEGSSTISGNDIKYGIFSKGDIEIKGSGSLTVKTQYVGIYSQDNINISDDGSFIRIKNDDARVLVANSLTLCGEDFPEFSFSELLNASSIVIEQGEVYWIPKYIIVNGINITDGENVEGVSYDYRTGTLNLKDVKITESSGEEYHNSGIYYYNDNAYNGILTVNLEGDNTIKGEDMDYAIYAYNAECQFTGSGTLNAEANINGIFSTYDLSVDSSIKELCLSAGSSAFYANQDYFVNIGSNRIKLTDQKVCIQSGEVALQESEGLYELKVGNADILSGEKVDGVSFDPDTCTLTLNNVHIVTDSNYLIKATGNLNIRIIGDNSMLEKEDADNLYAGIYVEAGSLNICGSGTLTLENSLYTQIKVDNSISVGGDVMIAPYAGKEGGTIFADTLNIYDNAVLICGNFSINELNHDSGILIETYKKTGTVKGDVTLSHDLTINEKDTLTIPEGSSLTVPDGIKLINKGTLIINGTLFSNQDISGDGTLQGEVSPTEDQNESAPATGNDISLTMWIILMAMSIAVILMLLSSRRKSS